MTHWALGNIGHWLPIYQLKKKATWIGMIYASSEDNVVRLV